MKTTSHAITKLAVVGGFFFAETGILSNGADKYLFAQPFMFLPLSLTIFEYADIRRTE